MIRLALVLLISALVSGCVGWRSLPGGEFGDIARDEVRTAHATLNRHRIAYDKCAATSDDDCEREMTAYAGSATHLVNLQYFELVRQLRAENHQVLLGLDTAIAGLTSAGTFAFGGETNEILSGVASVVNSGRRSYEATTFSNNDVLIMIAAMEYLRLDVIEDIQSGLRRNDDTYGRFELETDLNRYRQASSLAQAQTYLSVVTNAAILGLGSDEQNEVVARIVQEAMERERAADLSSNSDGDGSQAPQDEAASPETTGTVTEQQSDAN